MQKKLLIITPFHECGMELLKTRPEVEAIISDDLSPEGISRLIEDANGIVVRNAQITRPIVEAAGCLEVVSRHGVGYDKIDVPALTEHGIPLTITPRANAVSVAEHAIYLMLSLAKQGLVHHRAVEQSDFGMRYHMRAIDLQAKRLLIVGFGRTGSQVAPRARAFDMEVHVYDPYVDDDLIETEGCLPRSSLASALPEIDIVTVHCPLNDETRGIIGASEIALMRSSAFIINTARGGVVDELALAAALEEGRIAGAGIDVYGQEPPAPDHPLFGRENVVLSPHLAGVSREASMRAAVAVVQNAFDAFDGVLDPAVVVNPEVL